MKSCLLLCIQPELFPTLDSLTEIQRFLRDSPAVGVLAPINMQAQSIREAGDILQNRIQTLIHDQGRPALTDLLANILVRM